MMDHEKNTHRLGGVAFLPILVFLALYVGCGLAFTLMGVAKPFSFMPHDGGMLIVTQLSGVSPIEVMKYCYYIYALILASCITIQFETHEGK